MTAKITKIFILIILFYGNKQCLCGVCMMIFTRVVSFKRLLLVWKGVMCMFGGWGKCVKFVSMPFERV